MAATGEPKMLHGKQILVLLLGVVMPIGAQVAAPDAAKPRRPGGGAGTDYTTYDAATLEQGKAAFVSQCGFCHGSNARGGEGGPDLLRAELVADDENGNLIGPVILSGRPAGMPKFNMSASEISRIAAFLHAGIRAAADRGTYTLLNIVTGDPRAGEAYFNGAGKCGTCHSATGDLKGIATKYDPIALQGRFLMPLGGRGNQRRATSPIIVTVTLPSGQSVQGPLERIDDFNIALTDANGDYRSFTRNGAIPKVELKDPLQAHYDLLSRYTDTDIHNLTAWLVTLK